MELVIESRNLAIKNSNPFDEDTQIVVLGAEFDRVTFLEWNVYCIVSSVCCFYSVEGSAEEWGQCCTVHTCHLIACRQDNTVPAATQTWSG